MFLGIEIGGTKLQLGVGTGKGGVLEARERTDVDKTKGAEGIRRQIVQIAPALIQNYGVQTIGIGFGGPVNATGGHTIRSFQIEGWNNFPLSEWSGKTLGLPTSIENDSNLAGLGEARFGAGKGKKVVVYSNIGSGIGGALAINGELYLGGGRGAVLEIGHLRPGLDAESAEQTVESMASGWGIEEQLKARLRSNTAGEEDSRDHLINLCDGDLNRLTGKIVVEAVVDGNRVAEFILNQAIRTYGWALAQTVTLLAPDVIVIGGGIAQIGEARFLAPLRLEVERYVIPPLRGCYEIIPAALGEEVVVHGAIAMAADAAKLNV